MSRFSKEELSFVKELPKHVEIECRVCSNILTDPHQVTCCGHNFCGSCIKRVKAGNGSCPMCKEKKYQSFIDKKYSRIINGLEVYCSNKEKGCQWKGELKKISTHLNKEKREGECQYEKVKCRYEKCQERKQRRHLKYHEDKECPQRPFQCQYCGFLSITKDHYEECWLYPVTCPNKCESNIPRGCLTAHVNTECPLEPVDCEYSWAGCNDKPLRKDLNAHKSDTKHMPLLTVASGPLREENEKIEKENKITKEKNMKLKNKNKWLESQIGRIHNAINECDDTYPLLPITNVTVRSEAVHFYTNACGYHMSARIMEVSTGIIFKDYCILLAFHKGSFDKFRPKLPKIFAKYENAWLYSNYEVSLLTGTEANYRQLHNNILNTISSCDAIPQGVIKIDTRNYPTCVMPKFTIDVQYVT